MRVTNQMLSRTVLQNLQRNLGRMQHYQNQMSSGRRVNRPSDDPLSVVRVMGLKTTLETNEQYKKNIDFSSSWLEITDTALGSANDVLQRARELAIYGASDGLSDDARKAISLEIEQLKGNLIISNLVSEIVFVDSPEKNEIDGVMEEKARALQEQGKTPYVIPLGGSVPLGALGYWRAFDEVMEQSRALGMEPTHLVFAWGSGGTHAGLVAGALAAGSPVQVMAINVDDSDSVPGIQMLTAGLAEEALALAGSRVRVKPSDILVWGDYTGEDGYGKPSRAGLEAMKTLVTTEGILVDPVYTGKAMAGLMDLVRKGYFPRDAKVVFIHTGGYGAIFAYPESYISAGRGN